MVTSLHCCLRLNRPDKPPELYAVWFALGASQPSPKFSFTKMRYIHAVFDKYPGLFKGKEPPICTEIPEGWVRFLEQICSTVANRIPASLLHEFKFEKISCLGSYLEIEYCLPEGLCEDDVHCIGGVALGMTNRAFVGCVKCGQIVKTYPFEGGVPRCKKHRQPQPRKAID